VSSAHARPAMRGTMKRARHAIPWVCGGKEVVVENKTQQESANRKE